MVLSLRTRGRGYLTWLCNRYIDFLPQQCWLRRRWRRRERCIDVTASAIAKFETVKMAKQVDECRPETPEQGHADAVSRLPERWPLESCDARLAEDVLPSQPHPAFAVFGLLDR